jgi:toxin HigB-1
MDIDKYGKKQYYIKVEHCNVYASKSFTKQLHRLPKYIKKAVSVWIEFVELEGVRESRKFKGYHDEPLQGSRKGQRSVRLSRAYRLIYEEHESSEEVIIQLVEVTKHAY